MSFDQTGSLANMSRHDYLPFGEELFAGTGGRTTAQGYVGDNLRQKFTGYENDSETQLNFAQARYQSPVQGRFTSADPAGASMTFSNPQSLNRYAYVLNSPTNLTDPSGMVNSRGDSRYPWDDDPFGDIPWTVAGEHPAAYTGSEPPTVSGDEALNLNEQIVAGDPQNSSQDQDVRARTEQLFRDCITIIEGHLTPQLYDTIHSNNRSKQTDPLLIAHAAVESTLGTQLVGLQGELGLFQLKPSTARSVGLEKFTNQQLRDDFALNTRVATTYLQRNIDAFGGYLRMGLGAYKQGAASVSKSGLSANSQVYADAIIQCANHFYR